MKHIFISIIFILKVIFDYLLTNIFFFSALNTFPNFLSDLSLKYLMDGGGVIKFRVKMSSTLESLVWVNIFQLKSLPGYLLSTWATRIKI